MAAFINAVVRDTVFIRDTVQVVLQKVEMVSPDIQPEGVIDNDSLKGNIRLPEAIALIAKYRSNERKELFPMIHHPNLRRHMKGLRDLAGIKTDLVYHQSRHTFGTHLVSAGVPIENIAKMMGHTNIHTTQGYAKVTDDNISEDTDRLIEKINSQNSAAQA